MVTIKGITVELNGNSTNLNSALSSTNKTVSAMNTELRTVNGLLKLDPDNVVLVKQKADILKTSINATKEKLKTLNAASKQVKAQYAAGKIDDGQFRAFQQELEKTKSSLKSLKDQRSNITGISAAFSSAKGKIEGATTALKPVAAGVRKVGEASATVFAAGTKSITAYTTAALAAGTAVIKLTGDAASAADDINTLSKTTGLSTAQIQEFQYASATIDVDLETLTGSLTKLTKNMDAAKGGTGAAAETFAALGVETQNADGSLRDNNEVFNDCIAALGKMENETERDAAAMQILGRSAQDLNPLIEGGAETLTQLSDSANAAGLILSQDALDGLNAYQDSLDLMSANATGAGRVLAGTFAPGLSVAASALASAIPSLTGFVAEMFGGGDVSTARAGLTDYIADLATNAIDTLGTQLPTLLAGFNGVVLAVLTGLSAALPGVVTTILPALLTGLTDLVIGLVELIPTVVPTLIDGAVVLFMGILDGLLEALPVLLAALPTIINKLSTTIIENLPTILATGIEILISLVRGIVDNIPVLLDAVIALIPVIVTAITENLPTIIAAAMEITAAIVVGIVQAIPQLVACVPTVVVAIANGFVASVSTMWGVGKNLVAGLWQGITNATDWLMDKISGWCSSIVSGIQNALGIHSPSTVIADKVGVFMGEGVGIGWVKSMGKVSKMMRESIPTNFTSEIIPRVDNPKPNPAAQQPVGGCSVSVTNNSPKALSEAEIARQTRATMQRITAKNKKGGAVTV